MADRTAGLQDEMSMFEQEIGSRSGLSTSAGGAAAAGGGGRAPVIAANTFSAVQTTLTKLASGTEPPRAAPMFLPHQLSKPSGSLPPPPPPPPPPEIPGMTVSAGGSSSGGNGLLPPPPPGYVPPPFVGGLVRPRMPHHIRPSVNYVPPPPGFVRGPRPPPGWRGPPRHAQPATVISSAPKVYASKPQLKHASEDAAGSASPTPPQPSEPSPQPSAFTLAPPRRASKAPPAATNVTTVTEEEQTEASTDAAADKPKQQNKKAGQSGKKQAKQKKPKKFIRTAGGQIWEDKSLHEWNKDDFRIFAGDLGNDVTEDVLVRYFSVYPSFVRAKVVRDKRTNKTKGYGFISFRESDDYVRAMKEMNGKYVGSRPIKLRKSAWRDRQIDVVRKKQRERAAFGLL